MTPWKMFCEIAQQTEKLEYSKKNVSIFSQILLKLDLQTLENC